MEGPTYYYVIGGILLITISRIFVEFYLPKWRKKNELGAEVFRTLRQRGFSEIDDGVTGNYKGVKVELKWYPVQKFMGTNFLRLKIQHESILQTSDIELLKKKKYHIEGDVLKTNFHYNFRPPSSQKVLDQLDVLLGKLGV